MPTVTTTSINIERVQRILDVINTTTDLPEVIDSLCAESFPELRAAFEAGMITTDDAGLLVMRQITHPS